MLADIVVYLWAVISNWAGLIWAALFVTDLAGLMLRKAEYSALSDWLDKHVVPEDIRVPIVRTLLIIGLFIASFIAWDDQYHVAIGKSPEAIESRMSQLDTKYDALNAKYDALNASYQSFIKTSADRISAQAQGADALRKEALTMSATIMAFAAETEAEEPKPPLGMTGGSSAAMFQQQVDSYRRGATARFIGLHKPQLHTLLQQLRASGVSLARSDYVYENPFSLNDLRQTATDLATGANQLF
jgi:hypothetical protein